MRINTVPTFNQLQALGGQLVKCLVVPLGLISVSQMGPLLLTLPISVAGIQMLGSMITVVNDAGTVWTVLDNYTNVNFQPGGGLVSITGNTATIRANGNAGCIMVNGQYVGNAINRGWFTLFYM